MIAQHTLSNETVQVLIVRSLDAQAPPANIVDGLVIHHEAAVRVLEGRVCSEDGIVRLDDGCCHLGGRVDAELQLALLSVINGETLHQQSAKSRSGSATEGVENQEALETGAAVSETADLVQDLVDQLLSDGVMTTSVVVGSILLSGNHVLGMEQAAVGASSDFIDDVGLQISVDGPGNVFSLSCTTMSVSRWSCQNVIIAYRSQRRMC